MQTVTQQWLAPRSLEALKRLNLHALDLLFEAARQAPPTATHFGLPEPARSHLLQTLPAARGEAARVCALLVEVRFQDAVWWQQITSAAARSRVATVPKPSVDRRLLALHRATLAFAWHLTQFDWFAATILLGLSPPVTQRIADLNLIEVERIAERTADQLRPRWLDRPAVWCRLLGLADGLPASRLARIQLLQLLEQAPVT